MANEVTAICQAPTGTTGNDHKIMAAWQRNGNSGGGEYTIDPTDDEAGIRQQLRVLIAAEAGVDAADVRLL